MVKPNNWETIEPDFGDYEKLPAGGYVCKIVSAGVTTSKSGNEMLKLCIDIAEGNFKDRFLKQRNARNDNKPWWAASATYYQLTEGEYASRFKGLITTLEKINPTFKWDWNENHLTGLRFGGIFREEEYVDNKGNVRTATKIYRIVPIEGLEERPVPTKKTIDRSGNNGGFNADIDEDIPF